MTRKVKFVSANFTADDRQVRPYLGCGWFKIKPPRQRGIDIPKNSNGKKDNFFHNLKR
jgi:hypothetical protein